MLCDDQRKFNNFLQYGHRKKRNPKTRSLIKRNVAPAIISVRIEFKQGIFAKKTIPNTTKAIPFTILLHFFGFTKFFPPYQLLILFI